MVTQDLRCAHPNREASGFEEEQRKQVNLPEKSEIESRAEVGC